jgi:hypothetical protein
LCGEPAAERIRMNVVGEDLFAVDLDDGKPLPIARLELGVAGDVDLLEREAELGA